jgi:VanZ family protein
MDNDMEFRKWSRIVLFIWGISICTVIYYSLLPEVKFPVDFWNADKVYHCASYGWLAVLPMVGFSMRRIALPAALSMIILGVLLEIGQYFVPGRDCSFWDMVANGLGVVAGILVGDCLRSLLKHYGYPLEGRAFMHWE